MEKYRIRIVNKIAREGLDIFDVDNFEVGPDVADPHGLLVRSAQIDTDAYPSLLAVARAGAGVNNITVDKAIRKGICVFNTPGANANAVAELVFIMLGMYARNIHQGIDFCRNLAGDEQSISQKVEENKSRFRGFELAGKTMGVLGLGKIGIRVANAGIKHGMRVLGFDPFPALENIHQLSPDVLLIHSIKAMAKEADIFTLHLPLNDKTRGMVGADILDLLPDEAILVNYARGEIVDEEAVLNSLEKGRLAGFITDFPSPSLVGHDKVITSPHLGASTEESEEQCACMAARELKGYLLYGTVSRSVNFPTVESIPSGNVHTRMIMINRDVPGMIGFASHTIGSHGINIASYINESNGLVGYNIIDLESAITDHVINHILGHQDVIRIRTIRCN